MRDDLVQRRMGLVLLSLRGRTRTEIAEELRVSKSTVGRDITQVVQALTMTKKAQWGENRQAAESLIAQLTEQGVLIDTDVARLQSFRSLALAVDETPDNAQLWRQYREAEKELAALDDSTEDDTVTTIRGSTEMGNVTAIR